MTHVVVVGDAVLDIDVETRCERVAPDSGAPVLDEVRRVHRPGGAALAARLAAADTQVTLVTAIADDLAGIQLRAVLGGGVRLMSLPGVGATGVKTRLRRGAHVLARLDHGGAGTDGIRARADLRELIAAADAVLVSDYGRGVVAGVRPALGLARTLVWDPHPRGGPPRTGTTLVTPNTAEAGAALHRPPAQSLAEACEQVRDLLEHWRVRAVALTRGPHGAVLAGGASTAAAYPAQPADGDPCGAGDRFAAAAAAALAGGALPSEAVGAAVTAASRFVAAGGVTTLDPLHETLHGSMPRQGVLVATGGCFDLLHAGHIATLEAARRLGDRLVVCVNSDDSVRRAKGADRPVQPVADRVRVLRGLRAVDDVVVFDEDTPLEALRRLRPDVWVKGGDYAGAALPETPLIRSWGGEIVTVPYLAGRSTTSLLARGRP